MREPEGLVDWIGISAVVRGVILNSGIFNLFKAALNSARFKTLFS